MYIPQLNLLSHLTLPKVIQNNLKGENEKNRFRLFMSKLFITLIILHIIITRLLNTLYIADNDISKNLKAAKSRSYFDILRKLQQDS